MENPPQDSILAIVDRLAKLEGLLIGLQTSISQGQASTAASIAKVERLEERQLELERRMVTKGDLAELGNKVDSLIQSDAERRGGTQMASWSASSLATWAAILLSLLALVGVGANREQLRQQDRIRTEQVP